MGSTRGDNKNAKAFVSFDLALIHELTPEFDSLVMAARSQLHANEATGGFAPARNRFAVG